MTDWQSRQTGYAYDDAGRLTQVADPNGVTSTLSYDNADRLTGVAHAKGGTDLEAIGYQLDPAGNRTQMQDSAGTTTWAYDALDRLTTASYPNGDALSYGYDPVGNRTGLTVNGQTTTSTYDAADELTAAGGTTYTYDPLNRLTGISGPTTAAYAYNGDGLRVAKTVSGQTTNYTWDPTGLGRVLADWSEYLWGVGLIGQVAPGGAATYARADALGSVRMLTNSSGAVAGREQYDTYGAPRAQSGA